MNDTDKLVLLAREVEIMRNQQEVNDVFERRLEDIRRQLAEFEPKLKAVEKSDGNT